MNTERIFIPSFKRLILVDYLLPVGAGLLSWLLRLFIEVFQAKPINWVNATMWVESFVIGWSLACFLWIGLNRDWFAINIDSTSISGAAPFGGRNAILRSQIDRVRTQKQSRWQRLKRSRVVWDSHGNHILLSGWYFSPEQVAEILAIIGCE